MSPSNASLSRRALLVTALLSAALAPMPAAVAGEEACLDRPVLQFLPSEDPALTIGVEEGRACLAPLAGVDQPVCFGLAFDSNVPVVPVPCSTDSAELFDVIVANSRSADDESWNEGIAAAQAALAGIGDAQILSEGERRLRDLLDLPLPAANSPADPPPDGRVCRTAETAVSDGDWTLAIVGALPALDTAAFSGVMALPAAVPDHGNVRQSICYDGGGWTSDFPETRLPTEPVVVQGDMDRCIGGFIIAAAGIAVVAAGSIPPGPWTPAAIAAGGAIILFGASEVANHCGDATTGTADQGWMHCEGSAWVEYGGEGGNSFDSRLLALSLGLVSLSAGSFGPGATTVPFPFVYNAAGYWSGWSACENLMDEKRREAWAAYWDWGTTASGPQDASAFLRLDLPIVPLGSVGGGGGGGDEGSEVCVHVAGPHIPIPPILDSEALRLEEDFDPVQASQAPHCVTTEDGNGANQNLLVGCDTSDCNGGIATLMVSACGAQSLTPGGESVTYEFTGFPGCVSASVSVGGFQVSVALPLQLNLDVGGAGGAILAGGLV